MQNMLDSSKSNFNVFAQHINKNDEYYASDIYEYLREVEKRRYKLNFNSVQAASRPQLISILMEGVNLWQLNNNTLYLATYFLDVFMDVYAIATDNLKLTALTCLLLANKVEGSRGMLRYEELASHFKCLNDKKEFKRYEMYIMETFKAEFTVPTVECFANYFVEHSIAASDLMRMNPKTSFIPKSQFQFYLNAVLPKFECYNDLLHSIKNLLGELINICMLDIKMFNILPSLLAASCVAVARHFHNLQPVWTSQLELISRYSANDVFVLKEAIAARYEKNVINYLKLKVNDHDHKQNHPGSDTTASTWLRYSKVSDYIIPTKKPKVCFFETQLTTTARNEKDLGENGAKSYIICQPMWKTKENNNCDQQKNTSILLDVKHVDLFTTDISNLIDPSNPKQIELNKDRA